MPDSQSIPQSIPQSIHFQLLEEISRDLSGETNFPTCMDAALLVRDTLKDPETSLEQVARVVSIEPLISSKILRMANTAAHNTSGKPISELGLAISRLGFESVRTISLAVALDQMLKTPRMGVFARLAKQAWEHSLQVAAIARVLARHIGRINADEAMLAGLVRDIGVFYLLYRASSLPLYRDNEALLMELLTGWHESIGESLLQALNLPDRIIATLRDPQQPDNTEAPCNLHDILYFADLLSKIEPPWNAREKTALDDEARQADALRFADLIDEASENIRQLHAALAS